MKILSIETSCDDSCIAVIRAFDKKGLRFDILSNIVSSQIEIHKKYGGVYPTLAKREHQKNLVPALKGALGGAKVLKLRTQKNNLKLKTLKEILSREEILYKQFKKFLLKYQKPNIDLIAVTIGPGLEPCLWVGVNFAKALSYYWGIPIISTDHIKAHIFVNDLKGFKNRQQLTVDNFPAVCLVVSGGHTQLILMKDFGKYKIIGETRDDAAGECFDKTARILGLGYPGGPAIAAQAEKARVSRDEFQIKLPRPMINQKNYDFSFSGLKTAVLYDFKNRTQKARKSKKYIQQMSVEIQQAIIDVLIKKTIKAAKNYKAKSLLLGGGVTANNELRKQLKEKIKNELPTIEYLIPDTKYCTDNAVMVAITGYFRWRNGKIEKWQEIKAQANLRLG